MIKCAPKRLHFNHEGMLARTQLVAPDHNSNVGRQHATTTTGSLRYKSQYSRQKGDYVTEKIFQDKSYTFAHSLMQDVKDAACGKKFPAIKQHKKVTISRQPNPPKQEVVVRLQSRLRAAAWSLEAVEEEEEDS